MSGWVAPVVPSDPDPATLFGLLWPSVAPFVGDIISQPWDPTLLHEYAAFATQIVDADGAAVPPEIMEYVSGGHRSTWRLSAAEPAMRAFTVMRAIDKAFRLVLPETAYHLHGTVTPAPGGLMRRMRDRWLTDGCLAEVRAGYVALLGPLVSHARAEAPETRNGDTFEDQFVNLTIVERPRGGRRLRFRTLAPSEFTHDARAILKVGVAPIAQDRDDLKFQTSSRGRRCYLDATPRDSAATATRTVGAVSAMLAGGARLVALPELALDRASIEDVRSMVRPGSHDGGRVLVLGTSLTAAAGAGRALPYNEAVVIDGRGRILFTQRKMNHYSMSPERMAECRIAAERDQAHIENCTTGDELVVCDLPGMGRIMVLICEDFAQMHPGRTAAEGLSPDWIVTPILDIGVFPGRWTTREAFALRTASKVVVSGSTTLSARKADVSTLAELDPRTGVAMLYDGGAGGAMHVVDSGQMTSPHAHALVLWRSNEWQVVRLGLADRRPAG